MKVGKTLNFPAYIAKKAGWTKFIKKISGTERKIPIDGIDISHVGNIFMSFFRETRKP
jgi:hypothetical protein